MSWFEELIGDRISPDDLRAWAATQPSRAEAWTNCQRPDWQFWLAAHAPDLTLRDQRMILKYAIGLEDYAPDDWFWLASWMFPVPMKKDVVAYWGHEKTLGIEQKLKASGAAFVAALVVGILIDRQWFADYGEGFTRTLLQGVVCTIAWLLFILPMRAIWRWRIQRGLDGLTFAGAFELIWPRTVRLTKRFKADERPKRAHGVRIDLNDLGKRAFSYNVLADNA